MKVQLTYFKTTGKYYSQGEYETEHESLIEIWHEVRGMLYQGKRPGLVDGHDAFHILIQVADHPQDHLRLMLHPTMRDY